MSELAQRDSANLTNWRDADHVRWSFQNLAELVVRQPNNCGCRATQPLACKASSRRHIGHTSSELNVVRATAGWLPPGDVVCARTRVALARRMPNMPSQERLGANADNAAEPVIIRLTDH